MAPRAAREKPYNRGGQLPARATPMNASSLTTLIRRAMLVAAAPAISACGGMVKDLDDAAPDAVSDAVSAPDVIHPFPGCTVIESADGGFPNGGCNSKVVTIAGDPSACLIPDAGDISSATCSALCNGQEYPTCNFEPSSSTLACGGVCIGRMTGAIRARYSESAQSVGDYIARAATLEAAAVTAFEILARELAHFGAPDSLIRSARRAQQDESRHAATMTTLARSFGCEPTLADVSDAGARPMIAVALENVVEGCVRETFGAYVASWQAARANDPRLAAAMKVIARDETRHASLSWRVFDWLGGQLGSDDRARVHRAAAAALSTLEASLASDPTPALAEPLGLPNAKQARALLETMRADLWSDLAA